MNKIYQKTIPLRKNLIKRKLEGFTLIELLVVVLIIGILSAVALPQYQKAVQKSRFSQYLIWSKYILTAEEEYYLAEGKWSWEFSDLSVNMPEGTKFGSVFGHGTAQAKMPNGLEFRLNSANHSVQFNDATGLLFGLYLDTKTLECFYYNDESKKKYCISLVQDPARCTSSINSCVVAKF